MNPQPQVQGLRLEPVLAGGLMTASTTPVLDGGCWFLGKAPGDGFAYRFEPGTLEGYAALACDLLVDGQDLLTMVIRFREGNDGPTFDVVFNLLHQCQARMRLPLSCVEQKIWKYDREGAWMKARSRGDRVDLARVDRLWLAIDRIGDRPARFCMTPLRVMRQMPPVIDTPLLPRGKLLDELGQSTVHQWPGKTQSVGELVDRLKRQHERAPAQQWPDGWTRWGGDATRRLTSPTGFFRTHYDGRRWLLADPDGHAYFSSGLDCFHPTIHTAYEQLESALQWLPGPDDDDGLWRDAHYTRNNIRTVRIVDYLRTNWIRAFGRDWKAAWTRTALSHLRQFGFNSIGNFSEWQIGQAAQVPYVRQVGYTFVQTPIVYRDLPDVYDDRFEPEARQQAEVLAASAVDPALIGYFLMNEPKWGFANESPAEGMLFTTEGGPAREAFALWLRQHHPDDEALRDGWAMPRVSFDALARGRWRTPLSAAARRDAEAFSGVMVRRFFETLSRVSRRVDPNHLNLGVRFQVVPPDWALAAMDSFDVYSMNRYKEKVPADTLAHVAAVTGRPTMIGEWHFGALDVGVPGSGIGRVHTQEDRGRAFRVYLEDAAAQPDCVGVHYFTLYDQSALGRYDGENYQIGFLDVCNRPYEPLAAAARRSHERLYALVRGEVEPYADAPEYLSKLF